MSIYKRDFHKTRCMRFLIKEEKVFDAILKKVSYIMKNKNK